MAHPNSFDPSCPECVRLWRPCHLSSPHWRPDAQPQRIDPPATPTDDDSLAGWFDTYHRANPQVYAAFCEVAREKRAAGHSHYGAKTIMEILRWESAVRYGWSDFKLNNNIKDRCSSRYVRLLQKEDPSFKSFFSVRRVTSTSRRAKLSRAHKKGTGDALHA